MLQQKVNEIKKLTKENKLLLRKTNQRHSILQQRISILLNEQMIEEVYIVVPSFSISHTAANANLDHLLKIIHGSASKRILNKLNAIHNNGLRLA